MFQDDVSQDLNPEIDINHPISKDNSTTNSQILMKNNSGEMYTTQVTLKKQNLIGYGGSSKGILS